MTDPIHDSTVGVDLWARRNDRRTCPGCGADVPWWGWCACGRPQWGWAYDGCDVYGDGVTGKDWEADSTDEGRMNRTKIEWCDYTWNPIVGCSPISEGCAHCYAAAISKRFGLPWGTAQLMTERLSQPATVKKPSRIFVCSMSDIGHETVLEHWRDAVYAAMIAAPWHQYILLTKRPLALARDPFPRGAWLGVTVESQEHASRWRSLRRLFGDQRDMTLFVSVEPMLGPVSFAQWPVGEAPAWVIAGPETGPGARGCRTEWIDALSSESPCFFDKRKAEWQRREFPEATGYSTAANEGEPG